MYIDPSKGESKVMYCYKCGACYATHYGIPQTNCTLISFDGNNMRLITNHKKLSLKEKLESEKFCMNCRGKVEIIYNGPNDMPPGFGWLSHVIKILNGKLNMVKESDMLLSEYQKEAYKTAVYPERYVVIYPALALAEEAGEVSGLLAKALRDCDGKLDAERKARISKELGDVLWELAAVATDCGLNLDEIAAENLKKLAKREKEGKLHGEGSDR